MLLPLLTRLGNRGQKQVVLLESGPNHMPSSKSNSASHQKTASVTTALKTNSILFAIEPYFVRICCRMASKCASRAPEGAANLKLLQLLFHVLLTE